MTVLTENNGWSYEHTMNFILLIHVYRPRRLLIFISLNEAMNNTTTSAFIVSCKRVKPDFLRIFINIHENNAPKE